VTANESISQESKLTQIITSYSPDTHIYYYNGVEIPSVTQILTAVGLIDDRFFSDRSADRGTRFHEAMHQYVLTGEIIDMDFLSGAELWNKFLMLYPGWVSKDLETPVYSEWYAGTPDNVSENKEVIDYKTGNPKFWHLVQVGGYMELLNSQKGYVLYADKGRIDPVDPQFRGLFLNCLSVYQMQGRK
jgi:hypothetical protein